MLLLLLWRYWWVISSSWSPKADSRPHFSFSFTSTISTFLPSAALWLLIKGWARGVSSSTNESFSFNEWILWFFYGKNFNRPGSFSVLHGKSEKVSENERLLCNRCFFVSFCPVIMLWAELQLLLRTPRSCPWWYFCKSGGFKEMKREFTFCDYVHITHTRWIFKADVWGKNVLGNRNSYLAVLKRLWNNIWCKIIRRFFLFVCFSKLSLIIRIFTIIYDVLQHYYD